MYQPVAMSIDDLIKQVTAKLPEGTRIPSNEWVRLQFSPKLANSNRALSHTGKFQMRHKVQLRSMRKAHPDSHYTAALFKYFREWTTKWHKKIGDGIQFLCFDDKHTISVGEPGDQVTTGVRQVFSLFSSRGCCNSC